jgi:hypothetical protein
LSGTDKDEFDTVCSPITTFKELKSLNGMFSPLEKTLLDDVLYWEGELEKVQSIDFLSLNLAYKLSRKITVSIDSAQLPLIVKEVAKRIASLITPIFMVGDLFVMTFSSLVSFGTGAIRLFGGQSPAYLEEAGSLEVSLYNLVKIPLMLISSTVGMLVSLFHPESGQACMREPLRWMAYPSFKAKMLTLRSCLNKMEDGDHYLLPAVEVFPESERNQRELSYLPSYGSHMRYLLVEKLPGGLFKIELIERGALHRVTDPLPEEEAGALLEKVLALRFQFSHGQSHRERVSTN